MVAVEAGQLPPLAWSTRFAFMACAMPELIKSFAWDAFVLFYYAQVIGLSGFLLGLALAVILVFDAVADPYIGALSDRMDRAPLGRRHTLMAAAVVPFVIGIAMVFRVPADLGQWQIFAWLLGFGLLARVGISFWTVPAYAMGGELTRDSGERNLVAVMRNMGNQLAILTVPWAAFAWFFVPGGGYTKPQLNPAPYPDFGLFVAAVGGTLMIVGLLGTRSRMKQVERLDRTLAAEAPETLPQLFRRLAAAIRLTPNVGLLLLVALLVLFVNSVVNQLTLHLATYFWQLDGAWTPRLLIAGVCGSIVAMFVAPAWMKLIGTRAAMISGLAVFFLVQAGAVLLPLLGFAPLPATAAIGAFVFLFRVLGGFAYGLYVVPFNTVTYDIGDEHEANTGKPQQGLVASFMFIGLQVGSGLVALSAGSFLGIIDFPAGLPVDQMPQDKVRALAWFVTGLILVAGMAMAWLVGRFDVSAEKQARIRADLARMRARDGQPAGANSAPAP
ncbi:MULTISPECIES: MFS transporter [unclassified Sphingobium]|uniref:MFS transporter n=1 Tax=unclassified Sphingobium TaxID=2611147 RepID=UPI0035A571F5